MTDEIIVCPDCGQRYDPAIVRGEFRSRRGVGKKTRVGAQDVRTVGHRNGPHHDLHATVTRLVRADELAPLVHAVGTHAPPLLRTAQLAGVPLRSYRHTYLEGHLLWLVPAAHLEDIAVECGGNAPAFARRVLQACAVVRGGAAWWHAWMQANGIPPETIAQGYRVSRDRRADVWLGIAQDEGPMLRGVS